MAEQNALTAAGYKFSNLAPKHWLEQAAPHFLSIESGTMERLPGSTGRVRCSLLGTEYDCSAMLD